MTNTWKSKVAAAGAVVVMSLSVAGPAFAATKGTWKPSTGLGGMSPGAFNLACREIYGGKPTFDGGTWTCEMPDGRVVACDVDTSDATSKNCRTYTPTMRKAGGPQPEYFGPTSFSR